MYNKVDTNLNFVQREAEVLKFWKENDIANKCITNREGCDTFTFYDGPPTANGKPHIGHVLTRVIKDMLPRYQSMKGKKVLRKAGWDTHGLPVELEVEKLLGLDGKEQIEKYGIEPFIKKCRESVWKYKGCFTRDTRLCLIALAAVRRCPPMRWHRATRMSRSVPPWLSLRQRMRKIPTSWPGLLPLGHCRPTLVWL